MANALGYGRQLLKDDHKHASIFERRGAEEEVLVYVGWAISLSQSWYVKHSTLELARSTLFFCFTYLLIAPLLQYMENDIIHDVLVTPE